MSSRFDQLFRDDVYLQLKNRLFSYTLRRRHVGRHLPPASGLVLDVGSGVSPVAPAGPNTIYADLGAEAMRVLSHQEREPAFVVADAVRLPFGEGTIGGVVCSEVLEHVEEDVEALREFHRVLMPEGALTITFPIHPYYYTYDDRFVGHVRRYKPSEMLANLERIGFRDCRVRKVSGVLEKVATYVMVRAFGMMSRSSDSGANREPWWATPYRLFNAVWARVCQLEALVEPMPLITIVSVQCRKGGGS